MKLLIEKSFNTGELVLNYAEGPDNGPPLVLIHGFPRWWKDFQPIIPELSKNYHVFALDLRGHGKSGRATSYTFHDYKKDVIHFIEKKIEQPTILFGHSLGGWITLMIASTHPHLVKAAIIGDSPLDLAVYYAKLSEFVDWWTSRREYASKPIEGLRTELDEETAYRLSLVDPGVFDLWIELKNDSVAFTKLLGGYNIKKILESISYYRCPVLLLQGNTRGMSDRDVDYAKSVVSSISHVYLGDQGHYLGLDTGDIGGLIEALTPFLSSL